MIVSLHKDADIRSVKRNLTSLGLWVSATEQNVASESFQLSLASCSATVDAKQILSIPGVCDVSVALSEHPRIDQQGALVDVNGYLFSTDSFTLMCGPCSVENKEQIEDLAAKLAPLGVSFLRGGAFKPRSSPYSFQGHGNTALFWLKDAAVRHGLRIVTEILSEADVRPVAEVADLLQIGSRNMQNFALLKQVGRTAKPVLLKRAMSATVEEWLLAAEYLLFHGATGVILCERGIRSFDHTTRNLLDLSSVALLSHVHHLPVVVDPSHATGRRDLIFPLGKAALAAGASGLLIEVHDDPGNALSDGAQAVTTSELQLFCNNLRLGLR